MRLVLLSDIHANVTALQAVLKDIESIGSFDAFVVLGDLVNYGPRPNEVIDIIQQLPHPILVNLWGNHEYSLFGGSLDRFSTDRGRVVLNYTDSILTASSREYLETDMIHEGLLEKHIKGKHFLFVHGDLDDPYWGTLKVEGMNDDRYAKYDYILSGHSHIPHYVEFFYPSNDVQFRNKKRSVFINPGSVGQPRNHNPYAQYGILDTQTGGYEHRAVRYDVVEEQVIFSKFVDPFYKTRLSLGI